MISKNLLFSSLFLFLLSLAGCGQSNSGKENVQTVIQKVSPEQLAEVLDEAVIIDVRTPGEFKEEHIKNAINYNIADKDFLQNLKALDKNKPVYLYCKVGSRSNHAAKMLQKEGFKEINDLQGGILNWKRSKLPTEK